MNPIHHPNQNSNLAPCSDKSNYANKESWPVQIFRYTPSSGWEMYQEEFHACDNDQSHNLDNDDEDDVAVNQSSNNNNDNSNTKKKKGSMSKTTDSSTSTTVTRKRNFRSMTSTLTATPKKGCVEVKQLRLRIHLFANSISNSSSQNNNRCNTSSSTNASTVTPAKHTDTTTTNGRAVTASISRNATVVRRKDGLLITASRGIGAVLFRFPSIADCIAFSERLIQLNSFRNGKENISSEETSIQRHAPLNQNHPLHATEQNKYQNYEKEKQTNQVLSYLIQLLHDEDFLDFTDLIEQLLVSSPDCQEILKALEYPRVPHRRV